MTRINSPLLVKTLREICGEYHPTETSSDKRFVLPVGDLDIPVFVENQDKARYPEIRLYPFFDEYLTYAGRAFKRSYGDPLKGEYSDVLYRRGRSDTTIREVESRIEIYGRNLLEVLEIRDKLFERIERFRLAEVGYFVDKDGWTQDGNVYNNAKYDSSLGIFRVYDLDDRLEKTTEVSTTPGSWNITDSGLYVNPLTNIDNLKIGRIYNGGLAFYDGNLLQSRGIMSFKIVRSKKEPNEKGPNIPMWSVHTVTKYKDVLTMDVGKAYSKVNI